VTDQLISIAEAAVVGGQVVHVVMPPHSPREFTSVSQAGSLGVSFTGHRRAAWQLDAGPVRERDVLPGAAFLTMSSDLTWLRVAEQSEALELHPDARYVQQVADELGGSRPVSLPDIDGRPDAVMWAACASFRASLLCGWPLDSLGASTRFYNLISHVLTTHGGVRPPATSAGLLDRHRLARVVDYIDDNLNRPIRLEDLAAVAALSRFHFARSFRATTHLTPYGFVTARRMDRARTLLTSTSLSTEVIAECVGYTNVGHFREQFVRAFGARPFELRGRWHA
jgi:AraC family transcriptional regulator